jgi:lysozyme family protein
VRALTIEEAKAIYKAQYWDTVKGDDLPAGLDYAVFDFCVNSGPDRAVRDLQKVLGTVAVDGVMGVHTISECEKYGVQSLIRDYCLHRLRFMKSLKTWGTFGKGWERRVNEVRANAARMASKGTAVALIEGDAINEGEIDKARPWRQEADQAAAASGLLHGGGRNDGRRSR